MSGETLKAGRPTVDEARINRRIEILVEEQMETQKLCKHLLAKQGELIERIERAEKAFVDYMENRKGSYSINKTEAFNGDATPEREPTESQLKMTYEENIQNIRNIIRILPPNLVYKGRHSYTNIRALGGPHLTDEMIDEAYEGITHD